MGLPLFFSRQKLLLIIVCVGVFGAGIADVIFTDVIPIRPYTSFFNTDLRLVSFTAPSASGSMIGDLLGVTIIIILGSSLFGTLANLTTGRTIAHTGFTPNPNVTSSVGFVPIIQLIPFVFGAMILTMSYALLQKRLPGGL